MKWIIVILQSMTTHSNMRTNSTQYKISTNIVNSNTLSLIFQMSSITWYLLKVSLAKRHFALCSLIAMEFSILSAVVFNSVWVVYEPTTVTRALSRHQLRLALHIPLCAVNSMVISSVLNLTKGIEIFFLIKKKYVHWIGKNVLFMSIGKDPSISSLVQFVGPKQKFLLGTTNSQ